VKLVVADTSPINYLLIIGHISVLPALFHRVILPTAVRDELAAPKASPLVRNWIEVQPEWIEVRDRIIPFLTQSSMILTGAREPRSPLLRSWRPISSSSMTGRE